jgi:hypothetical protein
MQSITAMGGAVSTSQPNGVIAKGTLTAATGGISGPILWENLGAEFRYELPGPTGSIAFVSGHGRPAIVDGNKITGKIGHLAMVAFPAHLPATVLASELSNPNIRLDATQQATVGKTPAFKVSITDETDELSAQICKQDWYFDSVTMLPVRVDYLATEIKNALNTVNMTVMLSDYRVVSGVAIPFHIATFFDEQQITDVTLDTVQLNASVPAVDFDAPSSNPGGVQ